MRFRILSRGGAIAAVAALALAGGITPAEAATPPGFSGWIDTTQNIHGSFGSFILDGTRVWCVRENYQSPTSLGPSAGFITDHPQTAAAIAHFGSILDNDTQAALAGFINVPGLSPDGSIQQWGPGQATPAQLTANFQWFEAQHPGIATKVAEIQAWAAANAGPWSSPMTMALNPGSKSAGSVSNYGVQSAAGNWQAGYTGQITLAGPAVWDSTGTATLNFTTTAAAQSATWHATGTGTVDATRSVITGLPGGAGIPLHASTNLPQTVAASALPGTDPAQQSVTVQVYAPKVKTQSSTQLATAGQSGHDTVIAYDGEPGQPWSATVDVFMGLTGHPKDGIPASATPTTTLTVSGVFGADGTSTVDTGNVTFTAGYSYFWEHLSATPSTPAYDSPKGGETTETVLVLAGDMATTISSPTSKVGDTVSDTVSTPNPLPTMDVTGAPITYTLSGVLLRGTCGKGDWDLAHPVSQFGPVAYVPGSAYGSYQVQTADAGKCLTWVETITASSKSGTTTISHAPGLTSETTTVGKIKAAAIGAEIGTGMPVMTAAPTGLQVAGVVAVLGGAALGLVLLVTRKVGQQA